MGVIRRLAQIPSDIRFKRQHEGRMKKYKELAEGTRDVTAQVEAQGAIIKAASEALSAGKLEVAKRLQELAGQATIREQAQMVKLGDKLRK